MTLLSTIPPRGRALSDAERAALLEDMEAVVASSHLFKSLDGPGREELLQSGYVLQLEGGEPLIEEGEEGTAMYLVMSGRVRVEAHGPSGPVQLAELARGACVGEVSVLSGSPRTATVRAADATLVIAFEAHRVHRLLDRHPEVRAVLEVLVEGRARDTVEKLIASS